MFVNYMLNLLFNMRHNDDKRNRKFHNKRNNNRERTTALPIQSKR